MRLTEQYRLTIKPDKGTVNNAKGKIRAAGKRNFKNLAI